MARRKYAPTGLCVILVLTTVLLPAQARANDGDQERPIRLYAVASTGPIGMIAGTVLSNGALAVNGRVVNGDHPIWAGDLLQSRSDRNVSVVLDEIGRVTLEKGTLVRLSTTTARREDKSSQRILVASLVTGDMVVRLQQGVNAYVRACGTTITSSDGASFRVSAQQGQATTEAKEGSVRTEEPPAQRKYNLRPVGHGTDIRVRVGGSHYIRLQVTDENNRPLAEMPVMFTLGPGAGRSLGSLGIGTLAGPSYTTLTNSDGIASVPFTAGQTPGSTSVTAVIEETGATWTGQITVAGTHNTRNALIVVGVAAAIGAGVAIYKLADEKDDIRALPPESTP